jgi:hypothetical protein
MLIDFGIHRSLCHVLILFVQIKKYNHAFYIGIHSLKYFQTIHRTRCKVTMRLVTGDSTLVGVLTNRIKPKSGRGFAPKAASSLLRPRFYVIYIQYGKFRTSRASHRAEAVYCVVENCTQGLKF